MQTWFSTLQLVAWSLLLGAHALEVVLVRQWQSSSPKAFQAWYRHHGPRLMQTFVPMTVAGPVATIAAAALLPSSTIQPSAWPAIVSAAAVLALYFGYFARTNAQFREGTLRPTQLAMELDRWSRHHHVRWGLEAVAVASWSITLLTP